MATTATSIKLPPALKADLEKLARRSGETTHAVMVRALSEHVTAAKRYRTFPDDAARAASTCRSRRLGLSDSMVENLFLGGRQASDRMNPRAPSPGRPVNGREHGALFDSRNTSGGDAASCDHAVTQLLEK